MDNAAVWAALDIEIEYQRKKWGFRQPDGTFLDETHTMHEYCIFIRQYLDNVRVSSAMRAGDIPALDALREVIYLGISCLRQSMSIDDIKAIAADGSGSLCDFITNIETALTCLESTVGESASEPNAQSASINWLKWLVALCLGCFQTLSINPRDLNQEIINERDGLPA